MKSKGYKNKLLITGALCGLFWAGNLFPAVASADALVSEKYAITDYCGESDFSVFKDKEGYLYACGSNATGQLGRGNVGPGKKLEPYEGKIFDEKVASFDTGKSGFVLAITEKGELYGWGKNTNGQLAKTIDTETETNNYYQTPQHIELPQGVEALSADAGATHSLLLSKDGKVYAWGQNNRGQLGLSMEIKRTVRVTEPTLIAQENFGGEKIVQIATTEATSFALTASGKVYSWGDSDFGQMGDGVAHPVHNSLPDLVNKPVQTLLSGIKKISAEGTTAMALAENGDVYVWGNNNFKQFGSPEWEEAIRAEFPEDAKKVDAWSSVPVKIEKTYNLSGEEVASEIVDILCGGTTNLLLSADGDVYAFGTGGSGELGFSVSNAEKNYQNPYVQMPKMTVPTKVVFYKALSVEEIVAQGEETFLGKTPVDGTSEQTVKITKLLKSAGVRTYVMDEDGNVWSWGDNADGLVSSGNVATTDIPVRSTMFRDKDYDVTIKEKNYLIEPIIGLSLIYGAGAAFLIATEIKRAKQRKVATSVEKK